LFFTDSGPFGETSIENPKGSVFLINFKEESYQDILALAFGCLAYPSGLCLSLDENQLYEAEDN